MISIFDGMKASLDLATSVSVIGAVYMYWREQNKVKKREDEEEIRKALERTRVSFKDRKEYFVNKALDINNLIDKIKNEPEIDEQKKESIKKEINKAYDEIYLFLKILISEVKNEYMVTPYSIKNQDKKNNLVKGIEQAIEELKFRIEVGTMILFYAKENVIISLDKPNFVEVQAFTGSFISILCMPNSASSQELKIINGRVPESHRLSHCCPR